MIRLIKKWIINTFGFSKSETNGSLVLVGFVLLIALLPRWFINMQNPAEVSSETDKITLYNWYRSIEFSENEHKKDLKVKEPRSVIALNLKPFDPNVISLNELVAMGIPVNVANNMVSYRKAGGSFRIKSDLEKIYGIDQELYLKIEEYIALPENLSKKSLAVSNESIAEPDKPDIAIPHISINSTTAEELQAIRGIGPTLSKRIIKYRDLLGGFHSPIQLYEVYGLDEEVIQEIIQIVTIDSIQSPININSADLKSLSSHPYIDYALARAIINYKTVHGAFQEKTGIKNIKIVTDSIYNKLSPYISVRP